jgi:hypothetical protein
MSKFLLNLLVQISKALVYSKIQFLFEKELSSYFSPSGPALPVLARFARRPPGPRSAQAALAYLPKGVFPLTLRIQATMPSLSHVTAMWPRPSASSPSPHRPISLMSPLLLIASGHHASPGLQHRDANRSLHSPALTPPFNPPLIPSSSRPTFNGVKAITVGRFPLPHPSVPLRGHYKRARSTSSHHHTQPRPPLLAPESATPTPPSIDRRHRFPPSPDHLVTARAPVRPEPSSPCSPLSVVPPPASFRAPEWPEAMLR